MNELTKEQLVAKNRELDSNNSLLVQQLKDRKKEINKLKKRITELEAKDVVDGQMTIDDFI